MEGFYILVKLFTFGQKETIMAKAIQSKSNKTIAKEPSPVKSSRQLSTADILVMFGALQPGVAHSYYHAKMAVLTQFYFPGTPMANGAMLKPVTLNLTPPEELPKVSATLQKSIDCLLETADDKYPLLPQEYVVDDFVSTLAETLEEIPKGTVVLQRTTNFATLYYIVLNVKIEGKTALPQQVVIEEEVMLMAGGEFMVDNGKKSLPVKIAKGIGGAMVSKIGGFIAEAIWDALFPPGVPDYFDEVYKEITKIVDQKVDQSRIDSINGAIANLADKLANEYKPAKSVSNLKLEKDRRRLYDLLQKYDQTFLSGPGGMLGSLQQDQIAKAGFGVFLLGASLQLAIFQEMANIDPYNGDEKNGWKSPLQSSYGMPKTGSVSKMAKNYAEFASKTWVKILDDRKAQAKAEKFTKRLQPVKHNKYGTLLNVHYWVRVNDNGAATIVEKKIGQDEKDGKNPRYDAFCNNELVNYRNQKAAELSDKMENPAATIANWLALVEKPILV
ncbi:MAG: hypothetical protein ACO1PI_06245 [Bacteroidota bacterium]